MALDVSALPPREPLPRHVAIVMDGNGRWAQQRSLTRTAGHREGAKAVRRIVKVCSELDIEVLTLFAFSSENWRRPRPEVEVLMNLFLTTLQREIRRLDVANVRMRFIGDRGAFSATLQGYIAKAEQRTAANTGLTLVIAANYGGRWDIVQAARALAERGEPITEASLSAALTTAHVPDPDLVIRTGGEQRISNFLLWQSAYSEFYFSDKLWPDFDEAEFDRALASYAGRERRFGLISEQVAPGISAA